MINQPSDAAESSTELRHLLLNEWTFWGTSVSLCDLNRRQLILHVVLHVNDLAILLLDDVPASELPLLRLPRPELKLFSQFRDRRLVDSVSAAENVVHMDAKHAEHAVDLSCRLHDEAARI